MCRRGATEKHPDYALDAGHSNEARVVLASGDIAWVDGCLVGLIKELNAHGLRTTNSCCGHGDNRYYPKGEQGPGIYYIDSKTRRERFLRLPVLEEVA